MNAGEPPERLGILGGTFDPIHKGHLAMARAATAGMHLDRVLLIPSGSPPHKSTVVAAAAHRLEMVRLAAEGNPRLVASDLEVRRHGTSYTVDTLELLHRMHPESLLYFIVGEDSIPELPGWRALPRILELAQILTLPRGDSAQATRFNTDIFPDIQEAVLHQCEKNRLTMAPVPIASTQLRETIARGEPFDDEVPAKVARYIRQHGLYG